MLTNKLEFWAMNNPFRRLVQEYYELPKLLTVPSDLKNKTVLEIGCGNGYGTKLINKYFQPQRIIGIDLDEKMIAKALKNKPWNANFMTGDISKLPLSSASVDAIFDFGVIHHVPNWQDSLHELYRVLKKGGQIFLEDLSIETFSTPVGLILKKLTDHPYSEMFTRQAFVNYLEKIGFKITSNEIYRPLGIAPYFVVRGEKR